MKTVLSVKDIGVRFRTSGFPLRYKEVIRGVSFDVHAGETVALVGESGSGKSTIGRAILGLNALNHGEIYFKGDRIDTISRRQRRNLADQLQVVFQDPYGSLNPALTVGQILSEPLYVSGEFSQKSGMQRIRELLNKVHLPSDSVDRFPSSFSGGQRQRIAIARALARDPELIICDEPTSALDVTTQASVLDLLSEIQETSRVAYLFITHDLAVVRKFSDRTIVLRQGEIIEEGDSRTVCDTPQHPYTQHLVASAPVPDPRVQRERRAALDVV